MPGDQTKCRAQAKHRLDPPHSDGGRTKAKYRKNEVIFRQGDSADAVFYMMDGKCKATVVSETGREAVVAFHEKGDFFGEGCLTGQPRRLGAATAITVSQIIRFDKATMVRAIHQEPNVLRDVHCPSSGLGPSASKQTSSISCSIRVRNVLPGCSCCWRTSARKANRSRSSRRSARRRLRR